MNDLSQELLEIYQIDDEEVKLYLKSIKDSSPFRAQNDKFIWNYHLNIKISIPAKLWF